MLVSDGPERISFGKHSGMRRKLLVTSIFSSYQNVFYPMKGQVQHFSHIGNVVCNCCFIWTRLKLIDPYSNWFVGNLVLKNVVCNCCFIWTRLKLIDPYSNWSVGNLVLKNVVLSFLLFPQRFLPFWGIFCHFHQI